MERSIMWRTILNVLNVIILVLKCTQKITRRLPKTQSQPLVTCLLPNSESATYTQMWDGTNCAEVGRNQCFAYIWYIVKNCRHEVSKIVNQFFFQDIIGIPIVLYRIKLVCKKGRGWSFSNLKFLEARLCLRKLNNKIVKQILKRFNFVQVRRLLTILLFSFEIWPQSQRRAPRNFKFENYHPLPFLLTNLMRHKIAMPMISWKHFWFTTLETSWPQFLTIYQIYAQRDLLSTLWRPTILFQRDVLIKVPQICLTHR